MTKLMMKIVELIEFHFVVSIFYSVVVHSLLRPFAPPSLLTHSLTHSLTDRLTHLLTHLLTHSLSHSLTWLTDWLTHSLTHSLTPSPFLFLSSHSTTPFHLRVPPSLPSSISPSLPFSPPPTTHVIQGHTRRGWIISIHVWTQSNCTTLQQWQTSL